MLRIRRADALALQVCIALASAGPAFAQDHTDNDTQGSSYEWERTEALIDDIKTYLAACRQPSQQCIDQKADLIARQNKLYVSDGRVRYALDNDPATKGAAWP
jgi:hypothetical protein